MKARHKYGSSSRSDRVLQIVIAYVKDKSNSTLLSSTMDQFRGKDWGVLQQEQRWLQEQWQRWQTQQQQQLEILQQQQYQLQQYQQEQELKPQEQQQDEQQDQEQQQQDWQQQEWQRQELLHQQQQWTNLPAVEGDFTLSCRDRRLLFSPGVIRKCPGIFLELLNVLEVRIFCLLHRDAPGSYGY